VYQTRRSDGDLLLETTWEEFARIWAVAKYDCKLALPDKRPAVIEHHFDAFLQRPYRLYVTMPVGVWDRVRSLQLHKTNYQQNPLPRTRFCDACGSEMKVRKEMEGYWMFECKRCPTIEVRGKRFVGGTLGQGVKEKV